MTRKIGKCKSVAMEFLELNMSGCYGCGWVWGGYGCGSRCGLMVVVSGRGWKWYSDRSSIPSVHLFTRQSRRLPSKKEKVWLMTSLVPATLGESK